MILAILVLTIAGLIFSLGYFVFTRRASSAVHTYFALFSFSISVWIVFNYLGSNYKGWEMAPIFIYGDFFIGPWIAYFFWRFCTVLTRASKISRRYNALNAFFIFVNLLISVLLLLHKIVIVERDQQSLATIQYTGLYSVYGLYSALLTAMGLGSILLRLRRSKRKEKLKLEILLAATFVAAVFIVVPNIILPKVTSSDAINLVAGNLTYMGLAFFMLATAYAIVKHRLFDLRPVVARAVSYFLTWLFVAVVYFVVATVLFRSVLGGNSISLLEQVLYITFIVCVALSYSSIKSTFDRVSNRLFYRDAYDPQKLIEEVNVVMVSSIETEDLLKRSSYVIAKHLKAEFVMFSISKTDANSRLIGTKQVELHGIDAALLDRAICGKRRIITSEELDDSNTDLAKTLKRHDIDLLIRLRTSQKGKHENIGTILIGAKKSGNVYGKKDIKILQILADELVIAIQNTLRVGEIANFNETLQLKVEHATARLRKANEELKTLDALKDDFISTASHQLRSPAVSVHDALNMLNHPQISPAEKKELLILAESSSKRLVTVVRTLLNMARLQAGHFTIDTSEADMVGLVERELEQVKVMANQKSITIEFKKPDKPIIAQVDVAKITEAIANYVENAIKYSLEKTTVTVVLLQEQNKVRLEVYDQGMGVPPQERKDLFGRFYRATNARQEQPDGNGIGLYVVKNIAEGHGGEAYYRPGQSSGSVFGFWINSSSKQQPRKYQIKS